MLSALLRQNPRFHASMTSGLGSLVQGVTQIMSPGSETALTMSSEQRADVLAGLFSSYYHQSQDKEVIFDTNRMWTCRMPLLKALHPKAKVIACVRDLSWVLDSLERRIRDNPYHFTRLFGPMNHGTVYSRVEALMGHEAMVGRAWTGLKEAFYGDEADALLVVEYEYLSRMPDKVLRLIYDFIGEPWYDGHDFENVEFDAPDFDEALGISGLHKVRPKVEFKPRRTILPPDLFKKFEGMDFWREMAGSKAFVIAGKREENHAAST